MGGVVSLRPRPGTRSAVGVLGREEGGAFFLGSLNLRSGRRAIRLEPSYSRLGVGSSSFFPSERIGHLLFSSAPEALSASTHPLSFPQAGSRGDVRPTCSAAASSIICQTRLLTSVPGGPRAT